MTSFLQHFWPVAPQTRDELEFCGMCGFYRFSSELKTRECGTCGDEIAVCLSHSDIPRCVARCSPHTKVECEVCRVPMHRTVGEHVVCSRCEKEIVVCRLHLVENICRECKT